VPQQEAELSKKYSGRPRKGATAVGGREVFWFSSSRTAGTLAFERRIGWRRIGSTVSSSDRASPSTEEESQLVDRIGNIGQVVAVDIHGGYAIEGHTREKISKHRNRICDVESSIAVGITDGDGRITGAIWVTETVRIFAVNCAVPIIVSTVCTVLSGYSLKHRNSSKFDDITRGSGHHCGDMHPVLGAWGESRRGDQLNGDLCGAIICPKYNAFGFNGVVPRVVVKNDFEENLLRGFCESIAHFEFHRRIAHRHVSLGRIVGIISVATIADLYFHALVIA
jgi:hypothetical protein